jgi:hypothetical protein
MSLAMRPPIETPERVGCDVRAIFPAAVPLQVVPGEALPTFDHWLTKRVPVARID